MQTYDSYHTSDIVVIIQEYGVYYVKYIDSYHTRVIGGYHTCDIGCYHTGILVA